MRSIREKEFLNQAFRMIHEAGSDGILQVDMWKTLGVNTQKGSRIALKLLKREVIERRKELHNERWTHRLTSIKKAVKFDSIRDCPCIPCDDMNRCMLGNLISPIICKKLTYWMDPYTENEIESIGEYHENNIR